MMMMMYIKNSERWGLRPPPSHPPPSAAPPDPPALDGIEAEALRGEQRTDPLANPLEVEIATRLERMRAALYESASDLFDDERTGTDLDSRSAPSQSRE